MIDFRYHLVSLVAVFIALAIGIVLGAGPLRENLGEQLTEQVEQLRVDRDQMRTENIELTDDNADLTAYIAASGEDLVYGTMPGTSVTLILDHDSLMEDAQAVQTLVDAAGGSVQDIVVLQPSLWDPAKQQDRRTVARELQATWPAVITAPEVADGDLSAVIARTFGASDAATSIELTDAERTEIAAMLVDRGYVTASVPQVRAADALAYLSGDASLRAVASDTPEVSTARSQAFTQMQESLVTASLRQAEVTLVASTSTSPATSEGIVRTVRTTETFAGVASVDGLDNPSAPAVITLGLAEAFTGTPGAFGTANDATALLPSAKDLRARLAQNSGSQDSGGQDSGTASDGGRG